MLSGTEYEFDTETGFAGYDDLEELGAASYVATGGCVERRSDGTVEDTFTDLEFLGRAFGVEARAAELEAEARAELTEIAESVADHGLARAGLGEAARSTDRRRHRDRRAAARRRRERLRRRRRPVRELLAAEVGPEAVLAEDPGEAFVFSSSTPSTSRRPSTTSPRRSPRPQRSGKAASSRSTNTFIQPGTLAALEGVRVVAEGLHG